MGIIQTFQYQVPKANTAQVAMQHMAASRPGAWFFSRTLHHLDGALLRLSGGQVTLPGVVAGLPVLTVTTTGARTGQRRTTPLVGVPVGEDMAVIGTSFGQPHTPGWYYNMRAEPRVEVSYRNRTIVAAAREADEEERKAIWDRARKIYGGYDAYASRIKSRDIHIMILSA
jgi:deazaflavin-dependent oxidoreductase (nitroreductase family)